MWRPTLGENAVNLSVFFSLLLLLVFFSKGKEIGPVHINQLLRSFQLNLAYFPSYVQAAPQPALTARQPIGSNHAKCSVSSLQCRRIVQRITKIKKYKKKQKTFTLDFHRGDPIELSFKQSLFELRLLNRRRIKESVKRLSDCPIVGCKHIVMMSLCL